MNMVVRCPYCVDSDGFRLMVEPLIYICEQCGRTIVRDDPETAREEPRNQDDTLQDRARRATR